MHETVENKNIKCSSADETVYFSSYFKFPILISNFHDTILSLPASFSNHRFSS